jgi:hypothetical protein
MTVDGEVEACKGGKVKKRKTFRKKTTPQPLSGKLSDAWIQLLCCLPHTAVTGMGLTSKVALI